MSVKYGQRVSNSLAKRGKNMNMNINIISKY